VRDLLRVVEEFVDDLRHGLRALSRSPGFALTALLILALTIGAVSTVLSLYYAMVWRPVAAEHPRSLVVVAARRPGDSSSERVSYADYVQIRDRITTVRDLAASGAGGLFFIAHHSTARKLSLAAVSANFFPLLGVKPALGRFFDPGEDRVPGRDHVAVLSHHLWREGWEGSPAALGAAVKVNGVPFTIIGVAPESFPGVDPRPSELYVPTMMLAPVAGLDCDAIADPECGPMLQMIGRLREGITIEQARAEVPMLRPARWARAKDDRGPLVLTAFRPRGAFGLYGEFGVAEAFPGGFALFGVAAACLLLGGFHLGGLLVVRGASRAREIAIRATLGSTSLRLLGQVLAESLILGVIGGGLGILLSVGLTRGLDALFYRADAAGQPSRFDFHPDAMVVLCVVAISVSAALVFAVLPARKAIRLGSAASLSRRASAVAAPARPGGWLVAVQVAMALALVTVASLLSTSARQFVTAGHFDPDHVALLRLETGLPSAQTRELQRAMIQRLEALPGILAVSAWNKGLVIDSPSVMVSRAGAGATERWPTGIKDIAPHFFAVLGTPLLRGRDFDGRDSIDARRVAIVDDTLAQRLWPGGDPIGASIVAASGPPMEVVGVVADVSAAVRGERPRPQLYVPLWQQPERINSRFCVRVQGDPSAALPMLMRAVEDAAPGMAVSETMPMAAQIAASDELRAIRTTGAVASYAAALAVLLSAVGIYGTLAFSVTRRTREIGVRMAIGARTRHLVALIVKGQMVPLSVGLAAGLALAWAASRFVRHLLYGPASNDGITYAAAAMVLAVVGVLACGIPARRAIRIDPAAALRTE